MNILQVGAMPTFIESITILNLNKTAKLDFIQILSSKNTTDKDKICYPYDITDEQFYQICEAFDKANVVIVEIATIKFKKLKNRYLSNEEINRYSDYSSGSITESELSSNIIQIQDLIQKSGKQVLFVSHFHIIPNVFDRKLIGRKMIIDCLTKHALYFFNPTSIIQSNPDSLLDNSHYSKSGEVIIMNEIHKKLQTILFNL
jgi:hypothetical protein